MTLERSFRISALSLVGTGLATITLALASPVWLALGLGGFAAYLVVAAARPAWRVPWGLAALGVLLTLQGVLVEAYQTESVLIPAAHFLILIQLLWLVQERTNRHYGWLCVVSLFQMMLSGVLSVDMVFGLCFAAYLPVGVLTLILYNLRCELDRHGLLTPSRLGAARVGRRLLAGVGLVALAELVLTLAVFLYFPRFGLQVLQLRPVQHGPGLTGFSDEVRFGDLADILDNPEVVMSVRLLRDGLPIKADVSPLLWRGIALDTYDGTRWFASDHIKRGILYPLPFRERGRWPPHDGREDVFQEITLDPVGTRVLFHLLRPVGLRSATPNLDEVFYDPYSAAWSPIRASAVSLRYVVHSVRPLQPLTKLREPVRPKSLQKPSLARYLQLPPSLSPRVRTLAEEIVRGTPPERVYDRAKAIETYLQAQYRYALHRGTRAKEMDPVEDFLVRQKRGHCEYFAAGMVVLLRSQGIPARLVRGFLGGEWNEFGQFYLVRQRHAHAWVEAVVPSVWPEWVTFDPTPPLDAPSEPQTGWLGSLDRRLAHLRLAWNSFVVNYSSTDQEELARALTRALAGLPNILPGLGRERLELESGLAVGLNAAALLAVGAGAAAALAFVGLRLRRRLRPGGRAGTRSGRTPIGFYRTMLGLLRRRGFRRDPAATPREFAQAVLASGGGRYAPVGTLTEAFCRVRYGAHRLTPAERAAVARALADLARAPA